MFFARSASFLEMSKLAPARATVIDGQRDRVDLVAVERAVLERVAGVADLGQVALGELVGVDDDVGAARQVAPGSPCSAAGFIATSTSGASPGREDVVVGEVHLEGRDARQRAGGRADLGREVRAASTGRCRAAPVSEVNRSPVSCMPSPESPAKRMTTRSSCRTCLVTVCEPPRRAGRGRIRPVGQTASSCRSIFSVRRRRVGARQLRQLRRVATSCRRSPLPCGSRDGPLRRALPGPTGALHVLAGRVRPGRSGCDSG